MNLFTLSYLVDHSFDVSIFSKILGVLSVFVSNVDIDLLVVYEHRYHLDVVVTTGFVQRRITIFVSDVNINSRLIQKELNNFDAFLLASIMQRTASEFIGDV